MTSDDEKKGIILVTGATGFVGSHLTARLSGAGHAVRALARRGEAPGALETAPGDVTDPESLKEACAGVDTVIHLVAVIREKEGVTFQSVNHMGTVNMLSAARESGVRRFIYVSALGSVNDPAYKYAYSKWQAEEAVRSSGIPWTILRPSVIYGRGFGFMSRMAQSLRLSPPFTAPVPGGGRALFQPVAVEDVVECLARILEAGDKYNGRSIDIGGPAHVSYAEMLDALMEITGQKRIKIPVPVAMVKAAAPVMGVLFRDPPVTPVELKQLDLDNVTDVDSIEKNFGFRPREFRQGLTEIKGYLM